MSRPLAALALLATLWMGAGPVQARNNPRATRRTFVQPRIDPRRRPVPRTRLTEFQPVRSFQPRPIAAALPQRRTYWVLSGRTAQIDRNGSAGGFGSFRFYNNRVLHNRRTSFRPRR